MYLSSLNVYSKILTYTCIINLPKVKLTIRLIVLFFDSYRHIIILYLLHKYFIIHNLGKEKCKID